MKQIVLFITLVSLLANSALCAEFGLRYDRALMNQGFVSPLIEVSIAGTSGIFLLDSGASISIISTWFAKKAGIRGTSLGKIDGSSGASGAMKLSKVQLKLVSSAGGSVTYKGIPVAIVRLPAAFQSNGVAGILSPQQILQKDETCFINLGTKPSLSFRQGTPIRVDGYHPLKVVASTGPESGTSKQLYAIEGKVYGLKVSFIIDTGADGVAIGAETATGKALLAKSTVTSQMAGGITGKPVFVRLLPRARVRLLGRNLKMKIKLQPVSARMPADGLLGMSFLKNCSIIFSRKSGAISCNE